MKMKASDNALSLIKSFEGCKLKAYRCAAGVLTIGWGHTGADVLEGMTIEQSKADRLLVEDVRKFEASLNKLVNNVNQNQFDALISFAFNLGIGNLTGSTLLKKIKSNDFVGAESEFLRWNKAGGKVLAGLTRRREAERNLFSAM